MPGTVKSELLPEAESVDKCDRQEKVCRMADFYLDKGHFITARRAGLTLFDEDDVCAGH